MDTIKVLLAMFELPDDDLGHSAVHLLGKRPISDFGYSIAGDIRSAGNFHIPTLAFNDLFCVSQQP